MTSRLNLFSGSEVFKSQILIFFLKSGERLIDFFLEKLKISSLYQFFARFPIKSALIFLFVVSLAIAPDSQVQLSSLASARIDLSQREYGIVFISLSNVLLLFLAIVFLGEYRKKKLFILKFEIFLILFLIFAEISAIMGIDIAASLIWLLKLLFGFSIYFLFSRLKLSGKHLKLILYAFVTMTIVEVLLAGAQFIRGGLIGVPLESTDRFIAAQQNVASPIASNFYFRAVGTLSDPNNLSVFLALLLPISIVAIFDKKTKWKAIFYAAVVLSLATSLLTFSRWGMVTNLFAFSLILFLVKKFIDSPFGVIPTRAKVFLPVFLLIIGAACFVNQFISNRFLQFTASDASLTTREELINQALGMIQENPLVGIGGGNFIRYFTNYDFTSTNISQRFLAPVHNFVLLLITENGFGAPLVLLLAVIGIMQLFFSRIKQLPLENKLLALALFACVVTFFFNGLWALRSFEDRIGFLFFLILGILVNILTGGNYEKSAKS